MPITLKTPTGESFDDASFAAIRDALFEAMTKAPPAANAHPRALILADERSNLLELTPDRTLLLKYHDLPEYVFRLADVNFDFALTVASYFARGAFHELHPLPWERIERGQEPPAPPAPVVTEAVSCPKCHIAMDAGYLADSGGGTVWVPGTPHAAQLGFVPESGAFATPVTTYRCPRCNRLESFAR